MPRTKSAKKQLRQSRQRRLRNQAVKSRVKTAIRAARAALAEGSPQAEAMVREASRMADRAASKGVLHPNAAARRKSCLMRRAQRAAAS